VSVGSGTVKNVSGRTAADALRHGWRVVLATTAVGLLAGVSLAIASPIRYEAQAVLYVDPRGATSLLQPSDGLLSRYLVDQTTSRRVLERARKTLGAGTEEPLENVRASALRGTNTIGVTAQARTPERAADIANAVATALRDQNRDEAARRPEHTIAFLTSELKRLDDAIAQKGATADAAEVAALRSQYLTAYSRLVDQTLARTREMEAVSLLEAAAPPIRAANPVPAVYAVSGASVGLVLGAFAALIRGRFVGTR